MEPYGRYKHNVHFSKILLKYIYFLSHNSGMPQFLRFPVTREALDSLIQLIRLLYAGFPRVKIVRAPGSIKSQQTIYEKKGY